MHVAKDHKIPMIRIYEHRQGEPFYKFTIYDPIRQEKKTISEEDLEGEENDSQII